MKKILAVFSIICCIFALLTSSAEAGSKQRNTWIGVAVGAGGAILGTLLLDKIGNSRQNQAQPAVNNYYQAPVQQSGHYESVQQKIWVDTSRQESYWIPGQWRGSTYVGGHNETRYVRDGYWVYQPRTIWVND